MNASDDRITGDLLGPVVRTSWRFWAVLLPAALLVAAGGVSWFLQMWFGFGVTGSLPALATSTTSS